MDRKILGLGIILIILIYITFITILTYITIPKENKDTVQDMEIKEEKEIGTWRYGGGIENLSRRLHNNVWGLTDEEKRTNIVKSYIYYKYNGNFGWEWDRPDPLLGDGIYIPPIYPGVVIGASGSYSSTSQYFPIKVKDIRFFTSEVEYNYTKQPTGGYNLAYDVWLVDNKRNNKAEIMVWIHGELGEPQRYVADGINEYGYFYRPPKPGFEWDYHAFVLKDQDLLLNHKVNIKNLLDILIKSGKLDVEWDVLSIEFGSEIGMGSGRIEISKYVVNINGNNV